MFLMALTKEPVVSAICVFWPWCWGYYKLSRIALDHVSLSFSICIATMPGPGHSLLPRFGNRE